MGSISRNGSSRSVEMNGDGCKMSPGNRTIKHPLQDQWTLWYFQNDRSIRNWEDMQHKVTTFNTVEDFWRLHNHIQDASHIGDLNDYSLFKGNIRPMWEDKANMYGGRWIFNVNKQYRHTHLNDMWLDTMLYLIGATSEHSNGINGAVVNVRNRGDKIAVWTADYNDTNAVTGIGHELKKYLKTHLDDTNIKITYEMHNNKSSKPLFTL